MTLLIETLKEVVGGVRLRVDGEELLLKKIEVKLRVILSRDKSVT